MTLNKAIFLFELTRKTCVQCIQNQDEIIVAN